MGYSLHSIYICYLFVPHVQLPTFCQLFFDYNTEV